MPVSYLRNTDNNSISIHRIIYSTSVITFISQAPNTYKPVTEYMLHTIRWQRKISLIQHSTWSGKQNWTNQVLQSQSLRVTLSQFEDLCQLSWCPPRSEDIIHVIIMSCRSHVRRNSETMSLCGFTDPIMVGFPLDPLIRSSCFPLSVTSPFKGILSPAGSRYHLYIYAWMLNLVLRKILLFVVKQANVWHIAAGDTVTHTYSSQVQGEK